MAAVAPVGQEVKVEREVPGGWEPRECTDEKTRDLFLAKVKELATAAATRKASYRADVKVLDGGFWYANDYYLALKAMRQAGRLQFFIGKNKFYHGHPPTGFTHVEDKEESHTGIRISGYALKPEVSAAQGLANIRTSLSFIDCQEFLEIALYEVLLEALGEERFNRHFDAKGPNRLTLDPSIARTPLIKLLKANAIPKGRPGRRPIEVGMNGQFRNIPLYTIKHTDGDAAGFHVACIETAPQQKFIAFGLAPEGVTEREIVATFVQAYNAPPLTAREMYTAELADKIAGSGTLTNASEGTDPREVRRIAAALQLTVDKYVDTEREAPELVGFMPQVYQLDPAKILRLLS